MTTTNQPGFDPMRTPVRMLDDQREHWQNFTNPIKFDAAADMIIAASAEDGKREDIGVGDLSSWAYLYTEDGTAALAPIPVPGRPAIGLLALRKHAFSQLCSKVGAPADYIAKLPAKLGVACVNHGLMRVPEKGALLRRANGSVRAVLSEGYAPLDDAYMLDTLRRVLTEAGMLGDVRVRALALGRSTCLRMVIGDPMTIESREVGDIVETGFDCLNGEIGNRSVSIAATTYRLVCKNGMRRADATGTTRLWHRGDPKRLAEAFADAVPSTLAEAGGLRDRMQLAVSRLVDDVLGEIDALKSFGLTAAQTREVAVDAYTGRGVSLPADREKWGDFLTDSTIEPLSVYDVANAITHTAQRRGVDDRLTMEEQGARYLLARTR